VSCRFLADPLTCVLAPGPSPSRSGWPCCWAASCFSVAFTSSSARWLDSIFLPSACNSSPRSPDRFSKSSSRYSCSTPSAAWPTYPFRLVRYAGALRAWRTQPDHGISPLLSTLVPLLHKPACRSSRAPATHRACLTRLTPMPPWLPAKVHPELLFAGDDGTGAGVSLTEHSGSSRPPEGNLISAAWSFCPRKLKVSGS
jgi:hypothetical protein